MKEYKQIKCGQREAEQIMNDMASAAGGSSA